jgi:hypothetical protein
MQEDINRLQKQIDELKRVISYQGQTVAYGIDFANLTNFIEVVTVVPTYTPTDVYEQVKIYYNSGGPAWALYLYDNVNNVWKSVALT